MIVSATMTVTSQVQADKLSTNDSLSKENLIERQSYEISSQKNNFLIKKQLLLTVVINEQLLPDIYYAEELADGSLLLTSELWKLMNLIKPVENFTLQDGSLGYRLEANKDISWSVNYSKQTIKINASETLFLVNNVQYNQEGKTFKNETSPGGYLNYSASSTIANQNNQNFGLFLEGIGFNQYGSLVSSFVSNKTENDINTVRSETYIQRDIPENLETIVFGDTVASAGAWSRPVRYGGIRYSTDFNLRQGFVSYPIPSITGSAALPSTIDILINNQRKLISTVNPGPFEIKNFPVVNGSGDINLIVKNLLGVETLISQSYYSSPRILKKDLHNFSFESGFLRRNYGAESNSYDSPFISGTYRRGFDYFLTLEGRTEIQKERQAIGFEVSGLIANYAVSHIALATSFTPSSIGNHYIFGLERKSSRISANLQYEYFDEKFVQFASVSNEKSPKEKMLLGLGLNIYENLWISTNLTSQSNYNATKFSLVSASMSIPFFKSFFLNTYVSKQLEVDESLTAGIILVIPFENSKSIVAEARQNNSGQIYSNIEARQSKPAGPGTGYRLRLSDDPNQQFQAGISGNSSFNSYSAEINQGDSSSALRLATDGSLGMFAGLPFLARTIGQGSFGIVKIADEPNIEIYHNNQSVAKTNKNGLALVPNLLPYQSNQISIDPISIPLDLEIKEFKKIQIPYAKSGILYNFQIRKTKNVLIKLIRRDNSFIPLGARVHILPSDKEFYVAKRGEVYLTDLGAENKISVEWTGGFGSFTYMLNDKKEYDGMRDSVICDHE